MSPATAARVTVTPDSLHAEAWRLRLTEAPVVAPAALLEVTAGDVVLVVVAHPDDETLAMGTTLARLAGAGVLVHVLAMTRGEAALDHVGVRVEDLAERRVAELVAATRALGLAGASALDLPDSALSGHGPEMTAAVREAIGTLGAGRVATLWREDPHPDHRAAAAAALTAADGCGVPVVELGLWSTHWTDPVDVASELVLLEDDDPSRAAKRAALACYRTQTEPLTDHVEAVLPSTVLSWPHEYAVRA